MSRQEGKLVFTPSPGGLATAMASVNKSIPKQLWIGWPGIASDDLTPAEKRTITKKLTAMGYFPVYLTNDEVKNFYDGYCNDTLWPLFHYFHSFAKYSKDYWNAYKNVNKIFLKAVTQCMDSDSVVWVHDYHLMLLPSMLRRSRPDATIGFFLHIPFPSYELFRLLPNRKEIASGLVGADLLGFHVYDYARHFMTTALRTLGMENSNGIINTGARNVKADSFPISIDYKKFKDAALSKQIQKRKSELKDHYKKQKIILSVDRLDYSKGILKRLEAFEHFLKENPSYVKKSVLIIVAVPSRVEVDAYKDLREKIEQAVSRINGMYATVDWTPISYQFKNLPFEELVALYAASDVALVTPIRDGMNLVAKEYVASKQKDIGVLILSEMTGAIDELPEALRINPNDTSAVANTIKKALRMTKKEQAERLSVMRRRLARYDIERWTTDFLEQLQNIKSLHAQEGKKLLSSKQLVEVVLAFKKAKKRLLLLDYDGTLRPFVSRHEPLFAAPPKSLVRLLKRLTDDPRNIVSIVSGRTYQAIEEWFGHLPLSLVAEHGAWTKQDGAWRHEDYNFELHKKSLLPILERFTERTPGSRIEEKSKALVWHYRNVPTELAYARRSVLKHELNVLAGKDIGVYSGNKIIEIKPKHITKGSAIRKKIELSPADFILGIGDDYTDEDMFNAMPEDAYSIKVGLGDTAARFQVQDIERGLMLLTMLATEESA